MTDSAAISDLRSATCSNGAPSARNLLVTVFGDALLSYGDDTAVSVQVLTRLLEPFGVSERLVRTSLTRLVNDELLATVTMGRRSSYRVAPAALALFHNAEERIYCGRLLDWDESWTIVVVDGNEGTAGRRAELRQELSVAGLGVVAPNVMASPVVGSATAAAIVARVGGFRNVLVSRSQIVDGVGTLGAEELARRCVPLADLIDSYRKFTDRFGRFDSSAIAELDDGECFKLRTLLIAAFRRLVLSDPSLPRALLPNPWIGDHARSVAAGVYRDCAGASERHLRAMTELFDLADRSTQSIAERFQT